VTVLNCRKKSKKMKTSFSRLFGKPRQQRTTNDSVQKPTHTDRLLDQSSYNPTSHKATTIKTLTRRAQLVCDTPNSLRYENKYLERVFQKNNYNGDFIKRNIYRPSEADETNRPPYVTDASLKV